MKIRAAGAALVLIALLGGPVACGKYGEPSRSRPTGPAARNARPADPPALAPVNGSAEECPPDAQKPAEKPARP